MWSESFIFLPHIDYIHVRGHELVTKEMYKGTNLVPSILEKVLRGWHEYSTQLLTYDCSLIIYR